MSDQKQTVPDNAMSNAGAEQNHIKLWTFKKDVDQHQHYGSTSTGTKPWMDDILCENITLLNSFLVMCVYFAKKNITKEISSQIQMESR